MILAKGDYLSLQKLRNENPQKIIAFTAGVFDVFHPGHVRAIKRLLENTKADIVVVGIVSDLRARERKGNKRPILNEGERAEIIDAIRYVDYTIIMDDPSFGDKGRPTLEIVNSLRPDFFETVDATWATQKETFEKLGVTLAVVEKVSETSSSEVIERILNKYSTDTTS
jgi:D-beta-D-heptose 7-phosphate kinase/D-beta-D-heptose 1-phosphate adenosyltransferase